MMQVSTIYHHQLECRALSVKIEKLQRWMRMYRDGKVKEDGPRHVIDIMVMIREAEDEQKSILNNYKPPFKTWQRPQEQRKRQSQT